MKTLCKVVTQLCPGGKCTHDLLIVSPMPYRHATNVIFYDIFKDFFKQNVKFHCSHKMLSVVCLSVTRVYCDKTAEARIMQFLLKCSPVP